MGAEIIFRKGGVDLAFFCRSSYMFSAFSKVGILDTSEEQIYLTDYDFDRVRIYLEEEIKGYEDNISKYNLALEGLTTLDDRLECIDTIREFSEEIEDIEYSLNYIYILREMSELDKDENPMELIYSY